MKRLLVLLTVLALLLLLAGCSNTGSAPKGSLTRQQAVETLEKKLLSACETGGGHRCRLYGFFGGNSYQLYKYLEIRDVRLAYAPPSSIGNFGGEMKDEHPMLVLSGKAFNDRTGLVIGLPMTHAASNETNPFAVKFVGPRGESGYVLSHLNHIPNVGEIFEAQGWRFEVIDLDGRRIDKVLVAQVAG